MTIVNFDWDEDEDNIVEEYDDTGTTIADYTTEPELFGNVISQRRSGQDSLFHYDGQGSALALTNSIGDLIDTYNYSTFGEVTAHSGSTVNPFQYIGKKGYYRDSETGKCEVRRRHFDASQGRWLSKDVRTLLYSYVYVLNSPSRFIDPTGREEEPGDAVPTIFPGKGCTIYQAKNAITKWINVSSGDIQARISIDASRSNRPPNVPVDPNMPFFTDNVNYIGALYIADDKNAGQDCGKGQGKRVWLAAANIVTQYFLLKNGQIIHRKPAIVPENDTWYNDIVSPKDTTDHFIDYPGSVQSDIVVKVMNKNSAIMSAENGLYVIAIACVCKNDSSQILKDPGILSTMFISMDWGVFSEGGASVDVGVCDTAGYGINNTDFWADLKDKKGLPDSPGPYTVVEKCC